MKSKRLIRSNAGFTMIEIMIIVVIIGILAGLTLPQFVNYFRSQRVVGARTELLSDISYARSLAIARRTTFQLVFNGPDYQIILPGPNTVIREREAPPGVTITADADPNFYAHGLSDAANIVVAGGGRNSTVNLLPTGMASHD